MRESSSEQEPSNWRQLQRDRPWDQDLLWLCELLHRLQAQVPALDLPFLLHLHQQSLW